MRKLLCLILALAMVFSLAACGNGNSEPTNEPSSSNEPKNEKVKVIIGGTLEMLV